jgi:hypothetical protein
MAKDQKSKKVLSIADELDKLGYPGIAQMLRDAVTSQKSKGNESTTTSEGGEQGGDGEDGDGGNGGANNPTKKPPF